VNVVRVFTDSSAGHITAVSRHNELAVLLRTISQPSQLCEQGAALVAEARDCHAVGVVMAAARQMHSELLSTKHAVEDDLVTFVLDCERYGRRVHWVPGEGCALGHWRTRSQRRRITSPGYARNNRSRSCRASAPTAPLPRCGLESRLMDEPRGKIQYPDGEAWEGTLPFQVGWDVSEPGSYQIFVSIDLEGVITVTLRKE